MLKQKFSASALVLLMAIFALPPHAAAELHQLAHDWRFMAGDPAGAQQAGFDDAGWRKVSLDRTQLRASASPGPIEIEINGEGVPPTQTRLDALAS
jgi:hypothetical protein